MKTSDEFTSPPQDYNVVVPDGWFQLALDPDDRDRGIVALADRQFRGVDNAPHLKEQFMRDLQKQAKNAYKVGGTELYISTLAIGPVPLASSLLISVPAPDEWPKCSDAEELAEHLADQNDDDTQVGVVELAVAGKAVRQRRRAPAAPEAQMGNTLPTTTLTYYVPIPATSRWLMLNFSTPIDPLADQMVALFDTVAGTLHWG
ncbi:hypothetical protein ACOT81_31365 [Streptomyces sp. WI04-05B]|uniref:hypothetical protein n=1 Tax=Streptomyces TaxID=1883 RepID=UPI0029B26F22|nr:MULTISPECIES: hypothetical protein [unclassified Streptomyces]MDX2542208.1 hypothetical protein [Streptomyces sp. WI04-05B]MDX2584040.1 hypothetical protein [Streptomyces sp. WI04-05A]